jgi:hypothetical protein
MAVEPRDITIGDEVYVLIEAKCVDMHYPAEDPKYPAIGGVRKIPVLTAGTATFIDAAEAGAAMPDEAALASVLPVLSLSNALHYD